MSSKSNQFAKALLGGALLVLAAGCGSAPPKAKPAADPPPAALPTAPAPAPTTAARVAAPNAPPGTPADAAQLAAGTQAAAPAAEIPVPERAAQQYTQALQMMKAGRKTDAELEFKQLAVAYPQFAGPQLNLGLLYLSAARLTEAESAFKSALSINPANPVAGDELGIVERRLGKFADAEAAYQRAIDADGNYAPAHLNLGVLYDLYLAEPQKALEQFERYIEIAGENKQVAGWVIELKKRVGAPAAKKEQPA